MKIYLAPLENITTTEYRNTLHEMFGSSIDMYYMPFFMPHTKISLDEKDRRQLNPLHNSMTNLIPQILTDDAESFWRMAKGITELGYHEINLNIGCPSQRVSSKGRGAGLLGRKEYMNQFLYEVFEKNTMGIDISVKTRIGRYQPEEFYEILEIYNRYPIKELIIHPRTCSQKYTGIPYQEYFFYALEHSRNPVCYNGDIFTKEDFDAYTEKIRACRTIRNSADSSHKDASSQENMMSSLSVMIGRGLLANPALAREIKGGPALTGEELLQFMYRYREKSSQFPRTKQKAYLMNKSKELLGFRRQHLKTSGDTDNSGNLTDEIMQKMFLCKDYTQYLELEKQLCSYL